MPARRSEDPRFDPARETAAAVREHRDDAARRAARPAPIERSLPDRDMSHDPSESSGQGAPRGAEATSTDAAPGEPETDVQEATDR